jgi:ATP-binding cassette subfamily B protein
VFGLMLLRTALDVLPPLLVALALERLAPLAGTGAAPPEGFGGLVLLLAAVLAAKTVAFYASVAAAASLGQDLENGLRTDLFAAVMRLRWAYHDQNRSGKSIATSLRDMEKARHFFREVWLGWVEIALLLVAVHAIVFWTHWAYGLVVVATFGLGVATVVAVGRRMAVLDRDVADAYDDVAVSLQETVAGARVVRAFGREADQIERFGAHMDGFSGRWNRAERYWTGILPSVSHLYQASAPLVLAVAAWRLSEGHAVLADLAAVLLYTRMVHHRIRPLTRLVTLGQQAIASASRVFEVLDQQDRLPEGPGAARLPAGGGALRLQDVRFRYGDGPEVLKGVTLDVPAGTSLGILGPTGSGKSSLVLLLPRFYDPSAGTVALDGVDVRDLDVRELRAAVGVVFQEAFLFSGTVAENVAYGRPDLPEAEVRRCVSLAAAADFVGRLPEGLQTVVGERGVSLSGGERQRLTIARALAMDPRVLVFDDATASVDAVTERSLFDGIRSAARGRTTLVISQRVPSVRWCDRIAVLEDGRVAALGTHEDVLRESALYREAHRQQALGRLP